MHGGQSSATGILEVSQVPFYCDDLEWAPQTTLPWSVARDHFAQLGIIVQDLVTNFRATRGPTTISEFRTEATIARTKRQHSLAQVAKLLKLGGCNVRHCLPLWELERQQFTL